MWTVSHRIIRTCGGKKPVHKVTHVLCDDAADAVHTAVQWVVWSHEKGRKRGLPKWDGWAVDEWRDGAWERVKEGTYEDAKAQYREEDFTTPEVGAVSAGYIGGSQGRRTSRVGTRQGTRKPASRLAQFAADVMQRKR